MWRIHKRERYALIEQDEINPRIHKGTFHIGPRHVKHHATKEFVEHVYVENPDFASERDCRVFAQCSNIAVEVYDFYNKLYDPDYENVSVYDERFEVQYLFKEPDTWRSTGYYNPRIEVVQLEDGVDIKKVFDTDYGAETLEITFTVRTGRRLKHTIVFTNKTAEQKTFRVVMKLAGITSDKVKYGQTEEQITEEKHIVAPFLIFGEDNQHLALSEYLWSLGEDGGNPGEWSPTTLKNIILDTHVNGSKADIFIGNYTLAENESLLIDPDSDTWQVGAGTDDCIVYWLNGAAWTITTGDAQHGAGYFNANVNKMGGGIRWLNVTIPQGSPITAAFITLTSNAVQTATVVNTKIIGDDEDNAATFGTIANYQSRRGTSVGGANNNLRTTAEVLWDGIGAWALNTAYDSPEIKTVIQEIISRGGWSSGNALALFWDDHDVRGTQSAPRYRLSHSFNASPPDSAELTVTWEVTYTNTWTVDAAFQALGIEVTPDLDAAFQLQDIERTGDVDAAFQRLGIEDTADVDALFVLRLELARQLDAAFQKTGIEETADVDALFVLRLELARQIDVIFKALGVERTADLDAAFQLLVELQRQINAAFQLTVELAFDLDAAFQLQDIEKTADVDAAFMLRIELARQFDTAFKALGIERPADFDAAFQRAVKKTPDFDVIFKGLGIERTGDFDAAFQLKDIQKTPDFDAIFKALGVERTLDIDATFQLQDIHRTAAIDAAFSKLGIERTADLDALFLLRHELQRQLDAAFLQTDIPKSFGLDVRFVIRRFIQMYLTPDEVAVRIAV